MTIRFAREGWLFILPAAILTAAAILIQYWTAAIVLGLLTLFLFNFYRDPHRAGSQRHVDILSPADGAVVQIHEIADGEVWRGLTRQVAIVTSVFDVHVNRAPITGRIVHYAAENQQNLIVIEDGHGGCVAIKQIAGVLSRRIVFDKKEGDDVVRGERIGMIQFGSRVDVFLQQAASLKVGMRDKVKVGLTIIAELEERA
jgi:phosphatidylserine decarboxylase